MTSASRTGRKMALGLAALYVLTPAAVSTAAPVFSLPIDCEIGGGCQIQNYVDEDAGRTARDFACGGRTYDGHKGTDFRIRDVAEMTKGVKVLAAADGLVKAIRDNMVDVSIRDQRAGDVEGRECGNGVALEHADGWVTQYCHLREGSVRVKPGDSIARGAVLGDVGMSGFAEFAHVHFEVRNSDTVVDPFTGAPLGARPAAQCGATNNADTLWDARTRAVLAYRPAAFLTGGFAGEPVKLDAVEQAPPPPPTSASPALVAYVRVLGVRAGDMETLTIKGADGTNFGAKGPVEIAAPKAQWLSFFGRKRRAQPWQQGPYSATYRLERNGRLLIEERFSITLQ